MDRGSPWVTDTTSSCSERADAEAQKVAGMTLPTLMCLLGLNSSPLDKTSVSKLRSSFTLCGKITSFLRTSVLLRNTYRIILCITNQRIGSELLYEGNVLEHVALIGIFNFNPCEYAEIGTSFSVMKTLIH